LICLFVLLVINPTFFAGKKMTVKITGPHRRHRHSFLEKRLVGATMNPESLGSRQSQPEPRQPKETVRFRRRSARVQKRADQNDQCHGGTCEVHWKPLGAQSSSSQAAAQ
jgi:hypothetical protein